MKFMKKYPSNNSYSSEFFLLGNSSKLFEIAVYSPSNISVVKISSFELTSSVLSGITVSVSEKREGTAPVWHSPL